MKNIKLLTVVAFLAGAAAILLVAATPIISSNSTDFTGIKQTCKEYHITAKETNTLVAQTARLYNVFYTVQSPGTAWSLTIQDKQGTPSVLYSLGTVVAGGPTIVGPIPLPGALMGSGVDIITAGTTAGVMDLWACYR